MKISLVLFSVTVAHASDNTLTNLSPTPDTTKPPTEWPTYIPAAFPSPAAVIHDRTHFLSTPFPTEPIPFLSNSHSFATPFPTPLPVRPTPPTPPPTPLPTAMPTQSPKPNSQRPQMSMPIPRLDLEMFIFGKSGKSDSGFSNSKGGKAGSASYGSTDGGYEYGANKSSQSKPGKSSIYDSKPSSAKSNSFAKSKLNQVTESMHKALSLLEEVRAAETIVHQELMKCDMMDRATQNDDGGVYGSSHADGGYGDYGSTKAAKTKATKASNDDDYGSSDDGYGGSGSAKAAKTKAIKAYNDDMSPGINYIEVGSMSLDIELMSMDVDDGEVFGRSDVRVVDNSLSEIIPLDIFTFLGEISCMRLEEVTSMRLDSFVSSQPKSGKSSKGLKGTIYDSKSSTKFSKKKKAKSKFSNKAKSKSSEAKSKPSIARSKLDQAIDSMHKALSLLEEAKVAETITHQELVECAIVEKATQDNNGGVYGSSTSDDGYGDSSSAKAAKTKATKASNDDDYGSSADDDGYGDSGSAKAAKTKTSKEYNDDMTPGIGYIEARSMSLDIELMSMNVDDGELVFGWRK